MGTMLIELWKALWRVSRVDTLSKPLPAPLVGRIGPVGNSVSTAALLDEIRTLSGGDLIVRMRRYGEAS